ncbi:MAG: hypothetical protein WBD50_05865 [Candidatus Rhabdochlamydia sp.]
MIRYQTTKGNENIFNAPTQQIQKMENAYNTEGPKGPEVEKVIKRKEIS